MIEKTPILVAATTIPVPEHKEYETPRFTGTLKLNETVYMLVKQYDDKGAETVVGEYKMTNDKELTGKETSYVAKIAFVDQEPIKVEEVIEDIKVEG